MGSPIIDVPKRTIIKRDGQIQEFDFTKIEKAIRSAFAAQEKHFTDDETVINLVLRVVKNSVDILFDKGNVDVELIQDAVEKALMSCGQYDVAKSYILYREKHDNIRNWTEQKKEFINKYKGSFNTADATIDDNSNVASKNVGVLNAEIHKPDNIQISRKMIMDKLKELYPDFDSKQYVRDLEHHIIYKHDESSFAGAIAPYCCSISMYPFLTDGIKNLGGLSAAPKNLDSFCGMYINLIFATSAMFAGAVATSEFLLYFDYFARKEWGNDYWNRKDEFHKYGSDLINLQKLSKTIITTIEDLIPLGGKKTNPQTDVERLAAKLYSSYKNGKLIDGSRTIESTLKQYFQQVIYSINQPAAARGLQSAFVNFSYFDKPFFEGMFGDFTFPDGSKPIWNSLCWLQKEFMQWFNAERLRCILTFPVESVTLLYKDGEFVDKDMFQFVCDEYARGHSFFTYISDTVDSLSSCCRLKNKIQTKEFNFTNGNMGVMTGSKSVITLNLNRIIQDWSNMMLKLNPEWTQEKARESYPDLYEYLVNILERVYKYHTAYNEGLWDMYNAGLLPVYSAGFISLNKQYLTIGLNGLNDLGLIA